MSVNVMQENLVHSRALDLTMADHACLIRSHKIARCILARGIIVLVRIDMLTTKHYIVDLRPDLSWQA